MRMSPARPVSVRLDRRRASSLDSTARPVLSSNVLLQRRLSVGTLVGTVTRTYAAILMLVILTAGAPRPSGAAEPLAEEGDEKLVRVNGHVITRRELDTYSRVFYMTDELRKQVEALLPLEREQFYAQQSKHALRQLIERRLLLSEAEKEYLDRPGMKERLDGLVEKRMRRMVDEQGSMLAVHRWLRQQGITLREWRDLLAESILIQSYRQDKVESRVHVSPGDIRRYYEAHAEELRRPRRVLYRVILVDPEGCETAEQERAKAEAILEEVRGGADFAEMAEKHSLDRDKKEGGLRVRDAPQDPPDWLPPLCVGLKPTQVSDVQATDAGYCITKLERIEPSRIPEFEEVVVGIERTLAARKTEQMLEELVTELLEEASLHYFPAGSELRN